MNGEYTVLVTVIVSPSTAYSGFITFGSVVSAYINIPPSVLVNSYDGFSEHPPYSC